MKMSNTDITSYPKFAYYVRKNIPEVINVRSIVNAMRQIGQLDRAALQRALRWGENPTIKITTLSDGTYGEFTPDISSNELRIHKGLVEDFETGRPQRQRTSSGGHVYFIGVVLLHELIHWGDDQDGIDRPGEEGKEFERVVYGSQITDIYLPDVF